VDLLLPEDPAMSISSIKNVAVFDRIASPQSARYRVVTFGSEAEQLLYRPAADEALRHRRPANALIRRWLRPPAAARRETCASAPIGRLAIRSDRPIRSDSAGHLP